jgi:TetR/AcrR family transcriptional repressor of nem operon
MRYKKNHSEMVRRRVVAEAASVLWRDGPPSVPIIVLMARVGLTHGGFYAHFKSKDDLVAQSIADMFDRSCALLEAFSRGREPAAALETYVDHYLSNDQSEFRGRGCAIPAVGTDVSRMGKKERALFAQGTERLCSAVAELIGGLGFDAPAAAALAASILAEMSGAVLIARAIGPGAPATDVLKSIRRSIKQRLGISQAPA